MNLPSTQGVTIADSSGFRTLLILGLLAPLAVLIGYLLATPTDLRSIGLIGLLAMTLCSPFMIRYHHTLLILCWNASAIFFFLPGQPPLWTLMVFLSASVSLLNYALGRRHTSVAVRSVSLPLLALLAVVLVTLLATGGVGGRAFGSSLWGGKRYLNVIAAIIGYFAVTAQAIPPRRRVLVGSLFFLTGSAAVFADVAYASGFWWMFALFPTELAFSHAATESSLLRLTGVAFGALAAYSYMLARYGLRGVLDLTRPWRLLIFGSLVAMAMMGGYRSCAVLLVFFLVCQFFLERLHRTILLPTFLLAGVLGGALLFTFVDRLPLSVQRSLSLLPIQVHPTAKQDAESTLEWRFFIWKTVIPEIPRYLLVGKGLSFSGTDMYLTQEAMKRHQLRNWEGVLISSDYHNGPLTLIIPFGIFGVAAWVWFCVAGLRVLYRNYLYSEPELKSLNTFLLAQFVARLVFYVGFYGQFYLDLMIFTGSVGLSLALNSGVRGPQRVEEAAPRGLVATPVPATAGG